MYSHETMTGFHPECRMILSLGQYHIELSMKEAEVERRRGLLSLFEVEEEGSFLSHRF